MGRTRDPIAIMKPGGRATRNGVTYYRSRIDGRVHKAKKRDEEEQRKFYRGQ